MTKTYHDLYYRKLTQMCANDKDNPATNQSDNVSDQEATTRNKRTAIIIHQPERDGDRDQLIAALAAALVAIARQQAARQSRGSPDSRPPGSNVHTA